MIHTPGTGETRPITTSYVATETQRARYEDELPRAIDDLTGERGPFYLPVFPCELQSQLYETAPVCRPEGKYQFGPSSFFTEALWRFTVEQIWLANQNAHWGELIDKPDSGLVQAMSSISRFGMRLLQG